MKIVTALVACIALTWSSPLLPRQSLITPLDLIGGQRTLVAIVEDLIFNVTEIPKPGGAAKAAAVADALFNAVAQDDQVLGQPLPKGPGSEAEQFGILDATSDFVTVIKVLYEALGNAKNLFTPPQQAKIVAYLKHVPDAGNQTNKRLAVLAPKVETLLLAGQQRIVDSAAKALAVYTK